jgi:cell division septation protein DedD
MSPKKSEAKQKGKRYRVDLSRSSLFFWCLGTLFLLAWIFVLGILVGRGFFPQGVETLSKLRIPIGRLQGVVGSRKASDLDSIKGLDKNPEFEFYDQLSVKKDELAKKNTSGAEKAGRQTELAKGFETDKRSAEHVEAPKKSQTDFNEGGGQTKPAGEITSMDAGGAYTVQVASLDSESKAVTMAGQLEIKGYPAYVHKVNVKDNPYYRVTCGKFKDKKEAGNFKSLLYQKEKIKGFVTKGFTDNFQLNTKKRKELASLVREIKSTETGGGYTVQVASLDNENKAVKMADRLKNRGHPAYVKKVNVKGKTYYRVRCGRFSDKKEASDYEKLLTKQDKIKGFVIKLEE